MSTYLTLDLFKSLTTMPDSFVDEVETRYPGFVEKQLEYWSRWIDSRLRKRYAVPFAAYNASPPTPLTVQGWLARIVTVPVWIKRGIDANDTQFFELTKEEHDTARNEVLEAANSQDGWFDLPLRDDADSSAISKTGPLSYSESSPYVWQDRQRSRGTGEDGNGTGSYGG